MNNTKIGIYIIFTWIAILILFLLIKYFHLYPQNIISLNNFLTLGAVLGTILIGIGSNSFAKKQLEINQKTIKMELAIRYKDHYSELSKALREIISIEAPVEKFDTDYLKTLYLHIYDLSQQAELIFEKDIVDANIEISHCAFKMFNGISMINSATSILKNQEEQYGGASPENDGLKEIIRTNHADFNKNKHKIMEYLNHDPKTDQSKLLALYLNHTKPLREH